MRLNWGQRTRQLALELADSQVAVTRCAHCSWKYRGPVKSGKKLFLAHVEHEHRVVA